MKFYKRYKIWSNNINELISYLGKISTEFDWYVILSKEQRIDELFIIVEDYNLGDQFEEFALSTEQHKVEAFFKNFEAQINEWSTQFIHLTYGEKKSEFGILHYNITVNKLQIHVDDINKVANTFKRLGNLMSVITDTFEQLKLNYTNLSSRPKKQFYDRVRGRFLNTRIENPVDKYTAKDWLKGKIDEVLIRYYLANGNDLKQLMHPSKWENFNKKIELEYNLIPPQQGELSQFVIEDLPFEAKLVDIIVNRIIKFDGDFFRLFISAISFYKESEHVEIRKLMREIHNKIVDDNWCKQKALLSKLIDGSIDSKKLIKILIQNIEDYLGSKAPSLTYPISVSSGFSHAEVVDAYNTLLKGFVEWRYIRPIKELQSNSGEKIVKNYHLDQRSPYVEAEILVKSLDYLIQRLEKSSINLPKLSLELSFLCTLTGEQIELLFSQLNSEKYIDSSVTIFQFTEALLGNKIMSEPIQWLKSNRALAYLFRQMHSGKIIDNDKWQSIIEKRKIFYKNNNHLKLFTAQDLSQAISDYENKGNPREASYIDIILFSVKSIKG
ncbi:hypothetical protein [Spirosoma sp.]|uniref:hypothetical protein n=1 Tax=Spirosoma sp. TaxID=1899569 RepID=UPI003B3AE6C0